MYQTSLTKGQELVAQRMVREFRLQGHEAFLITSVYHDGEVVGLTQDEVKARGGYVHRFERELGIPVIRLGSSGSSWPPRRISFDDFVGTLRKIVDELDLNVLITNSTLWNGPEDVVKFVKWSKTMIAGGAPFHPLVFCHMSHFQEPTDERYTIEERSYREAWNSAVLPQVMLEADLILVTTPFEEEYMEKRFGAAKDQVVLFPGGIDDESIISQGDPGEFRSRHRLGSRTKIVAYLGTVEERKNALAVVEVAKAFSRRSDIRFVIAGKLEGDYGARVMNESTGLPNVSVIGPISEKDKASLIRTSFLNLSMSRSEALGIAQLEFMLMGVPVVTSGVGGQSWIVKHGSNGIVLRGPNDIEGAVRAITSLADNPSEWKRMSKKALDFASNTSIRRLISSLSRRLEEVIENHPHQLRGSQLKSDGERVIEACVEGGQNVVATTSRLLVRSVKTGTEVIAIPYERITKVARHIRAPWPLLTIGIAATALLLAQRMLGIDLLTRFLTPPIGVVFSLLGHTELTTVLINAVPFLPLTTSAVAFFLLLREGFLVYYDPPGSSLFLPKSFARALRVADRMTPTRDLSPDK
jgi:D-inositol-3-phosphate glycosyltransferase